MHALDPTRMFRLHGDCFKWILAVATTLLAGSAFGAEATITAGFGHTCALHPSGAVECWGLNDSGQLGDGTTSDRAIPAPVIGLEGSVVSILAGDAHTCALLTSGSLSCWGGNAEGQLGNGTTTDALAPMTVPDLVGSVETFSVGYRHTCAALTDGSLRCWGDNSTSQLGDGTTVNRLTPTPVSSFDAPVHSVALGDGHSCAITNAGAALCWGDNRFGQVGNGTSAPALVPTPVSGLASETVAISAGGLHTCAMTNAGEVFCWGDNFFGQVGSLGQTERLTPTSVRRIGGPAESIVVGGSFSCAILVSGAAQCWGDNFDGALGDGTTADRSTPENVNGLESGVAEIELGTFHACARTSEGLLYCWGDNFFAQLGNDLTEMSLVPVQALEFALAEAPATRPLPISLGPQISIAVLLALCGWVVAQRRGRQSEPTY